MKRHIVSILLVAPLALCLFSCTGEPEPVKDGQAKKESPQPAGKLGPDWGSPNVDRWTVAISDDAKRALVGYKAFFSPKLWDAETGKLLRVLEGHRLSVCHVSFRPDGKTALTIGIDGKINLYDAKTGALLRSITAYRESLGIDGGVDGCFAVSHDGRFALTLGLDEKLDEDVLDKADWRRLRLWDLDTGTMVRDLGPGHDTYIAAIAPDGRFGLFHYDRPRAPGVAGEQETHLSELPSGRVIHVFREADGWADKPALFCRDGRHAILGKLQFERYEPRVLYHPKGFVVWDVLAGKSVREFFAGKDLPGHFLPWIMPVDARNVFLVRNSTEQRGPEGGRKHPHERLDLSLFDFQAGKEVNKVSIIPGSVLQAKTSVMLDAAMGVSRSGKLAIVSVHGEEAHIHPWQVWDLEAGKMLASWEDQTVWEENPGVDRK